MICISRKQSLVASICFVVILTGHGDAALMFQGQDTSNDRTASSVPPSLTPFSTTQLDAMVAPIALYPDALVAQVLAAALYPDQIAFADDWLGQNGNLSGSALIQPVNQQPWDPSVKALTQFPTVLHNFARNLAWASNLGQAFENQQSATMAAVQAMRAKAQAAGTLQSTSQIKVVHANPSTIVIQPANPQVVYVPQCNPAVVYGSPLLWCLSIHRRQWQPQRCRLARESQSALHSAADLLEEVRRGVSVPGIAVGGEAAVAGAGAEATWSTTTTLT